MPLSTLDPSALAFSPTLPWSLTNGKIVKYCPIEGGNFGDELNTLLWPQLFPDLHQLEDSNVVYGIGTLLDGHHDPVRNKIVLGSGLGEAGFALANPRWDFRWVRGPLTAQEFGLPPESALGDAAILWQPLQAQAGDAPAHGPIGLVPHYRTWDSFDWERVAQRAGMVAINPRGSPQAVIAQIRGCSKVLAESLHGAICADALAVPWAPCVLAHRFNAFKWRDWLATIDRDFAPLVIDRPLVRAIGTAKGLANRLGRLVGYKAETRFPQLRPVAASTPDDVQSVALSLALYARRDSHFAHSPATTIARQRERMLDACAAFARDYQLRFTP